MTTRNGEMQCGLCKNFFPKSQYRSHVATCEVDDDIYVDKKICSLCGKHVTDLQEHTMMCMGPNDSVNMHRPSNGQKHEFGDSPSRAAAAYQKPQVKCMVCEDMIDQDKYHTHLNTCDGSTIVTFALPKKTKECTFCHNMIDARELADHMELCAGKNKLKLLRPKKKTCPVCHETIDELDLNEHIETCGVKPSVLRNRACPLCSEVISENEFNDHVENCGVSPEPKPSRSRQKECPICQKTVNEDAFTNHVKECGIKPKPKSLILRKKECPICFQAIGENVFNDHMETCGVRSKPKPSRSRHKECPICQAMVNEDDFDGHIATCNTIDDTPAVSPATQVFKGQKHMSRTGGFDDEVTTPSYMSSTTTRSLSSPKTRLQPSKSTQIVPACFSCSTPIDSSNNRFHIMPCQSSHKHCLKCLEKSMNQFVQSNRAPVCHGTLCDYELSRYDVSCLSLSRDLIQRLLTCVKSTQRAQCPVCKFYLDFNTMGDLERHVISCDPTTLQACEYCHSLFKPYPLREHSSQCRNAFASIREQTLADFVLPRTKYPLTAVQLRTFIAYRKQNRLSHDPRSLVDALASFGNAFPLEVPTRVCDICMEPCVYDDIFVFGCEASHKLCYDCFENSCTAKMNNNEILTCALCAYQLQEGEIKQLRVPADRKEQFLKYQVHKLFAAYAGSAQGVIRCPNQQCRWVAELQNPNDRFQVECPLCMNQFCSLCSQQYHFRTECQQIPEITQRWFFWCNSERGRYWQNRAQEDAQYRTQVQEYEQQRVANEQRNRDLAQRYNELLADENFKVQNCRLCPHCRRVVQHLGGCDSMVCGRNYHGGDQQSGCGQSFKWSQALPYTPIANTGPEQVRNDMPPPEQLKLVVHEGVTCDACHNVVQGIRFDCVHCPSLIFCEKCEQRSTLQHANELRSEQKQQHVFRLITEV